MTSERVISKTISALRLPLIIGVVFIHNSSANLPGMDLQHIVNQDVRWGGVNDVISLVSTVLASFAVPMFFFFSGYLFFFKTESFNMKIWKKKLGSRTKSLLIPYLFWAAAGVLVYGTLAYLPWTRSIFGNGNFSWSWRYIAEQFTGWKLVDGEHLYQMGYQLWFLRDLFGMVIISPLFYLCFKNNRWWIAAALCIFWIIGHFLSTPFNTTAIIFFGLGSYFGINKLNFLDCFNHLRIAVYIAYPLLVFFDWSRMWSHPLWQPNEHSALTIHAVMILAALPFWCNIVAALVKRNLIRNVDWLAAASFFVYLIHVPFVLPQVKKILYHIANPQSQEMLVALYFGSVFTAVAICLLFYRILLIIFPQTTIFITGGRNN